MKGPTLGLTDQLPFREMWKELAKELDGEFKVSHDAGRVIEIHELIIPYKKCDIVISVSDTRPLKFRAVMGAGQEFDLTVSQKDYMDRIMRLFTKTEVTAGWKPFDQKYHIRTGRPALVKAVLDKSVQETLLKYNVYALSYHVVQKTKEAELMAVIQKRVGTKEMILDLLTLFRHLIDKLERANIIR